MTDSGVNFYDYGIDVYEQILRDLKKNLIANQLSPIYFYNAGTIMKKESLVKGEFCSTQIFVLVDKGFVKESLITPIPASTYLCIYCNSFDKEMCIRDRLKELDGRFRQVVAQGRNHMIVVADKFPFRYFADEYGLAYRAAFSGCSTDTEPSAKTLSLIHI